jgi:glycogen debranching enzyme
MREYLDYTGDIEFLREKYPMMKKLLSTFLNKDRENGLIENFYGEGGYWNFYEWSDTMEGRFNETVRSIEAPINAYLSLALSDFAYIADKLGFGEDAEAYEAEKAECNRLRSLLEQAEKQNEAYAKQIIELDRQIDNQRLAGAFLNGDNAESKKKIDRLIKEIDKCITLMEG